ncbi:DNA-processing protein DprA [Actinomadura sp. 6K520]|uniref:DNA-processing protein DprA n=1 Tax=Actinomadura sp. 6K520 TaxID=2530364 RepID=UPI00104C90E8|nr:DNA-processing protein DprA [Actinomadura sp. 6K520]TDE31041.1 DNA-processing protein DprA [Actinomadura sp. 6K520]
MTSTTAAHAAVLAATEVVPADWRDLAAILKRYGGPEALLSTSAAGHGHDADLLNYIRTAIDPARVIHWQQHFERLAEVMPDVRFVTVDSKDYPANLKAAYGCPPFLFVRGKFHENEEKALAIVGSRKATSSGIAVAYNVAQVAVRSGITVVSGLARGIDAAGHRGAINSGGSTVAAIAAGIDHPLSRESDLDVAEAMIKSGAIVSQFRPGSPPVRSSYLQRNGVIAGLSLVSLIVEADERSGTRNEAEHSLRQGRKVLFWRPHFNNTSWVRLYSSDPLVKLVDTEDEVVHEVSAAAERSHYE